MNSGQILQPEVPGAKQTFCFKVLGIEPKIFTLSDILRPFYFVLRLGHAKLLVLASDLYSFCLILPELQDCRSTPPYLLCCFIVNLDLLVNALLVGAKSLFI